ncbi:hypothetical protein HFN89_01520 [Rhizobium laguerreae]|nr:hypothetical protein [Rhizobium laguerreae]
MRDRRDVLCTVPLEHDVPVVTEHDAPVALSYAEIDRNGIKTREEFRGYEGSLFRAIPTEPAADVNFVLHRHRLNEEGLFIESQERIKEVIERVRGIGKSYAKALLAPIGFADFVGSGDLEYRPMTLSDLQVKDYDEQRLARTVEAFRKKIAKQVIIGDHLYLPEPEPVMKMTVGFGDVFFDAIRSKNLEFGLPKGTGMDLPSLGFFRMDQLEEMLAEGRTLATTGRVFVGVEDVEVYDPSLLTANTEAMSLCEVAAGFAQRFLTGLVPDNHLKYEETISRLGKAMTEVPLAQFALYQRLLKGVEDFKREGDTSELEASVMTVLESDERAIERFFFLYKGNTTQFATEIARRWNDREVSLDSDFRLSTAPSARG